MLDQPTTSAFHLFAVMWSTTLSWVCQNRKSALHNGTIFRTHHKDSRKARCRESSQVEICIWSVPGPVCLIVPDGNPEKRWHSTNYSGKLTADVYPPFPQDLGYACMPLPPHLHVTGHHNSCKELPFIFILIPLGNDIFYHLQWFLSAVGFHALTYQFQDKVCFLRFLHPPVLYLPLLFRHIFWNRNNRKLLLQAQKRRNLVSVEYFILAGMLWGSLFWFSESPLSMDIIVPNRLEPNSLSPQGWDYFWYYQVHNPDWGGRYHNLSISNITNTLHTNVLVMNMGLYWGSIWLKSRISTSPDL